MIVMNASVTDSDRRALVRCAMNSEIVGSHPIIGIDEERAVLAMPWLSLFSRGTKGQVFERNSPTSSKGRVGVTVRLWDCGAGPAAAS